MSPVSEGHGFVKVAVDEITIHASFYLLVGNSSDNGIKIASDTARRRVFCSEWRSRVGSRGSWPPLTRSAAAPLWKIETGNWKLEIQNWRQPEIENRQFILRPRSGKMDERKKIYDRSHQVIENK
jgi:hypothetical protein